MNAYYKSGLSLVAFGTFSWVGDDIRALLVSSAYTFNQDHQFVSQLAGELVDGTYSRKVLASKSVAVDGGTGAVSYLAATLTWSALAGGVNPTKLILYKHVTNDADSLLIASMDVNHVANGLSDFVATFGGTSPGPALTFSASANQIGPAGSSVRAGNGVPASELGSNGDHYINLTNGDFYSKSSGTWSQTGNVRGPAGAAAAPPAVVVEAGTSRTLSLSDFGKIISCTSSSPVAIHVPEALALSAAESCIIRQDGTGLVTVVADGAVVVQPPPSKTLVSAGQYSVFALTWKSANVYGLVGVLA